MSLPQRMSGVGWGGQFDILVSVLILGVGFPSLYPPYFLNQLVAFYQTCMDTSLGQAKELIRFW